jgi:hypothetical protein
MAIVASAGRRNDLNPIEIFPLTVRDLLDTLLDKKRTEGGKRRKKGGLMPGAMR